MFSFDKPQQFLSANCLKRFNNLNMYDSVQKIGPSGGIKGAGRAGSNFDPEIDQLSEASKQLKSKVIIDLVNMLDRMDITPIDSESMTLTMHTFGINIRYLSHICVLTEVPHIKDICVTEMLARTFKNIINRKLSQLLLENKLEYQGLQEKLQ